MNPTDQEKLRAFHEELLKESDRGAALIGAAFLDEQLERILRSHFIEGVSRDKLLKGVFAPLSSFSARLLATRGLGLITEGEYLECNIIRKIRNEFAHQIHGLSFASESIVALTKNLNAEHPPNVEIQDNPRQIFINSVRLLTLSFWYRPEHSQEYRAISREYKYHLHFEQWYPDK